MAHWGWFWKIKKKHLSKTLCSKLPSIDSFKFYKSNMIMGFTVQPVDVKAEPYHDHLKISYRNQKKPAYIISVEKLPCNYGGYRYFFNCPLCKQRMRFLYFSEKSVFLCRKCLNLCYETQKLRPTKRYEHIAETIKAYMQTKKGDLYYKKPKSMHKHTYQMLKSKQFYYESKSHQALNNELRQWYGAKIEPYLDSFFDYVDESKEWKKN
jgi:hypothetical protein